MKALEMNCVALLLAVAAGLGLSCTAAVKVPDSNVSLLSDDKGHVYRIRVQGGLEYIAREIEIGDSTLVVVRGSVRDKSAHGKKPIEQPVSVPFTDIESIDEMVVAQTTSLVVVLGVTLVAIAVASLAGSSFGR